jgi:predicted esterase
MPPQPKSRRHACNFYMNGRCAGPLELSPRCAIYMRMNKLLCALGIGSFLVMTAACSHRDNASATPPAAGPQRGQLTQTPPTLTGTYTPAALSTLLAGDAVGKFLLNLAYSPKCTISVYHLEYETVDGGGALVTTSGALMVPSGSADCQGGRPVLLYAHGTASDQTFDLSNLAAGNLGEGLAMAAVFAAQGYIVVAPNYVGYDISSTSYHPYLVADQQSKDMIDALAAARSALPTADAAASTDGGKLFISGYSQGGYVAMATHRAMQAAGMTVTAAVPMSGPYALAAVGDAIFEGQVNASATLNFTLLSTAYQHVYGTLYTSATDVFDPAFAPSIDRLLPNAATLGSLEASGKLPAALFSSTPPDPAYAAFTPAVAPANLSSVFAAGFGTPFLVTNAYRGAYLADALQNPDGAFPTPTTGVPAAAPAQALRVALKTNDLRTWAPTAPVLLCGGNQDPTVFFFDTTYMQNYWTASAPATVFAVLDVDSAATSGDPYGDLKSGFAAAVAALRVSAVLGGATDGGDAEVLANYHAGLVPPFCLSAAKTYFDTH